MSVRAVLLDMDETLLVDRASTEAAMSATLADASAQRGLDARAVAAAVLRRAGDLWRAGPQIAFARRIGISSWEGLWASFAVGDDAETAALRGFAPAYRREAWRQGLRVGAGIDDADLAADLAERYVWERARRQLLFPEVLPVLSALRVAGCRLALVTNGDRDLQRRKAVASGLVPLFDHVVISGMLGVGKPEPGIFQHALRLCTAASEEALMVGDSLERDVAGGAAAGIRTVWLDRFGEGAPSGAPRAWATLPDLSGLPPLLGEA